jgi:hypothetical protein
VAAVHTLEIVVSAQAVQRVLSLSHTNGVLPLCSHCALTQSREP